MPGLSLPELREQVWLANQALVRSGLVTLSFGNASGVDRAAGVLVIKPSGVPYDVLRPEQLVVVSLEDGRVVEGDLRPSSDTPTHLILYQRYPDIGGVVHTHSTAATAWAQAQREIPALGTTHADHFHGAVPVTRQLREAEVDGAYEHETGAVIIETLERLGLSATEMPAALVASPRPLHLGPRRGRSCGQCHGPGSGGQHGSPDVRPQPERWANPFVSGRAPLSAQARAEGLLRAEESLSRGPRPTVTIKRKSIRSRDG